ncbi:MAG: hypothetical protein QOK43_3232 [Acidimicrobiaceae bacterium]|nr:hypothetical protein [Acidimicrobiaceae bacterium]
MRLARTARIGLLLGPLTLLLVAPGPARATVNDPGLCRQWALPAIGAPDAWATGTGAGTTIAVVDTGVDLQHEDLQTKVVAGANFVDSNRPPQDDVGHGSHVAGIAGAATNNGHGVAGVAPDARIMPVKVFDASGHTTTDTNGKGSVEAGIEYAADHGATVINLSLGDTGALAVLGPSFATAINDAWNKGSVVVVAAGNSGDPNSSFITSSNFRNEPAVVVTALKRDGTKATYASTVGAAKWGLAAPGGAGDGPPDDNVLSTWWASGQRNSYALAAGTSMAAPQVAGAAAILRSLGLSPQQTVDRLLATARDIGDKGDDTTYGHGALDLKAAVAGLHPAPGGLRAGGECTAPAAGTGPSPGTAGRTPTTAVTRARSTTSIAAPAGSGVSMPPAGSVDVPVAAPTPDSTTSAAPARAGPVATTGRQGHSGRDRRPWLLAALAAVLLAGAAVLAAGSIRPKPG